MSRKQQFSHWLLVGFIGLLVMACGLLSPGSDGSALPRQTTPTVQDAVIPATETVQTQEEATPGAVQAEQIPDPRGFVWRQVATSFVRPVGLTHAGDGSGRLFVVEKEGRILALKNGQTQAEAFLDIRDRIDSSSNERGLLGLAFHPNFGKNGFVYVHYSDRNGNTAISRFQVSGDAERIDPATEKILLTQTQPYKNHNGGMIAFGPDGYLYIGLGDGGAAGDPEGNGQNLSTLLGKLLRIDVDHGEPYSIPAGNPFVNGGGQAEIWAYGLRNPWRFSFDRLTGDLYVADVGQNSWEEVNFLPGGITGGANLGWDYFEGFHEFEGAPPGGIAHYKPVIEYSHEGGNCSVTGGAVYRGNELPEWFGVYLYGDYCSGMVWALLQRADGSWQSEPVFSVDARIVSFGEDEEGEIYLVGFQGGIYRLERE